MLNSNIICVKHKGLRFIDQSMNDIRAVCDKCGIEEFHEFPPLASNLSPMNISMCTIHNITMLKDILGNYCVYCIIEQANKKRSAHPKSQANLSPE